MPENYRGVPSEQIETNIFDYGKKGFDVALAMEQTRRLFAVVRHYDRNMHLDDIDDLRALLMEVLRDNHPGFQVKAINPVEEKTAGAPTSFEVSDLFALMAQLGKLMECGKITIGENAQITNESQAMKHVAESDYFQKRAREWKLFRRHPEDTIDQEKLVSKIHDVWRKDVKPFLNGSGFKKGQKLSKTQLKLCYGVFPIFDNHQKNS